MTYISWDFCILNNNKILFWNSQTEFSFVIENRDMTDFYLLYFTITFSLR